MGNDSSKNAVCTSLSSKKVARLRSKIIKEYPWLRGVEESMLITDCLKEDNPIVYASESFCKLTQYSKNEIEGRNCRFLQGPRTKASDIASMRENIQNQKAMSCKILNYRKDGSQFVNQLFIQPLFSRNGKKVSYYVGIQKEITSTYFEVAQDMEGNFGYRLFNWM